MRKTSPQSRDFDPAGVVRPERRGGVAWGQFNEHFARLQRGSWRRINEGRRYPLVRRAARAVMAWHLGRTGAIEDLDRKARTLSRFPIPTDPDVVFFGAEAGWEAAIVRALFGDGGRVVLVDCDDAAHERFLAAPVRRTIRAPGGGALELVRDADRIEYVRADFFEWCDVEAFDVGIDWGLVEHFEGPLKQAVMRRFQCFLRPGGLQITAVPRDTIWTRSFYATFGDELNFGHRELLTPAEFGAELRAAGWEVEREVPNTTTCIALVRKPRATSQPGG